MVILTVTLADALNILLGGVGPGLVGGCGMGLWALRDYNQRRQVTKATQRVRDERRLRQGGWCLVGVVVGLILSIAHLVWHAK